MRPVQLDSQGRKRCTLCKDLKHFSEFYPRYGEPGKYTSGCMICVNARARAKASAKSITRSTITIHPDGYALVSLHGKLGEGKFAKIDSKDIDLVSPYKWHFIKGYARTFVGPPKQKRDMFMHRLILGIHGVPFTQLHTDHKNHDGLDNRRENLREATPQQNNWNTRGYGKSGYKGVALITGGPS